jgi:hypothetical protein
VPGVLSSCCWNCGQRQSGVFGDAGERCGQCRIFDANAGALGQIGLQAFHNQLFNDLFAQYFLRRQCGVAFGKLKLYITQTLFNIAFQNDRVVHNHGNVLQRGEGCMRQ